MIDIVFLERKVIRGKRAHGERVDARRRREGKPEPSDAPKHTIKGLDSAMSMIRKKSEAQEKNAGNQGLSAIAGHVAEYVVAKHIIPEKHWLKTAASRFTETHPQIQEKGTAHNHAFNTAMAAIKRKPGLETNQEELQKKIFAALKRKYPVK